MDTPPSPDAAPLIAALNLLAQAWSCTTQEAQERMEHICANALIAAGAGLANNDQVPRNLVECLLRRDLDGFDDLIRQACRRVTMENGVYPEVGVFHRHGFQDDGVLRMAQAQATAARSGTGQPTTDGLLAAVSYAEAMTTLCRRKLTLLKNRTSVSFMGYMVIRRLADGREDVPPPPRKPLWKQMLIGAILIPLAIPALPFLVAVWLVQEFVE